VANASARFVCAWAAAIVVLRIDGHQHVASMNKLSLNHVYLFDMPVNLGTQGHHMAVHLRIIGVFVAEGVPAEVASCDGDHHRSRDHEHALAAGCWFFAAKLWLYRLVMY
jgi:hypothetical protein